MLETQKGCDYANDIPGYKCEHFVSDYKHSRANRTPGGFLICIKEKLLSNVCCIKLNDFIVKIVINKINGKRTYIYCVYFPPEGSSHLDSNQCPIDMLSDIINTEKNMNDIIVFGDMNARTGDLQDFLNCDEDPNLDFSTCIDETPRKNIDTIVNNRGKQLISFCRNSGLQIQNGRLCPTKLTCFKYNGVSAIDYMLCNSKMQQNISKYAISDKSIFSDHSYLKVEMIVAMSRNTQPKRYVNRVPPVGYRWDISKLDLYHSALNETENLNMRTDFLCEVINPQICINSLVRQFTACIENAASKAFRKFSGKSNNTFPRNEWFDEDCKKAKKELHIYNRYPINTPEYEMYWNLKNKYKALIQRKKRMYLENLANKIESLSLSNPQDYWKFWRKKSKRNQASKDIEIRAFETFYTTQNVPVENKLFDTKLMSLIDEHMDICSQDLSNSCNNEILNDILNSPITDNEIQLALRKAKNNKASGIDTIPMELIKYSGGLVNENLNALFNCILDEGTYPVTLCEGIINPLHKKGSKADPQNYRKITVISSMGKIFESILNNRAIYAKSVLKLEDPFQNGFKDGSRATDNAFMLNALIDISAHKCRPLYVCYVDFKSAFDQIIRSALFYKLTKIGFQGKYFRIVKDMYDQAKTRVKWDGELSDIFENIRGVLQGGVLSPTLFKIFMDDLKNYLDKNKGVTIGDILICYILFADDLCLISETKTGLQTLINGLETFCNHWQMEINISKTKISVFNKKYVPNGTSTDFFLCGNKLDHTDLYNFVGVLFSTKNNRFKENHVNKKDKSQKAIFAAKNLMHNTLGKTLPPVLLLRMYDTQIQPVLDYGTEIWYQGKEIKTLETVQNDFIKKALGVKRQTSTLAVHGETGRYPLYVRQNQILLRYWCRLLTLHSEKPFI